MLRVTSRFRFCVAQRNFFALPPLYPEKEAFTYRPNITTDDQQQINLHAIYRKKMQKITERVKGRVKKYNPNEGVDKITKPEPKEAIIKKVLKNVYIDEETNSYVGLFFDDFIYNIKQSRGQKYEAEYNKKVEGLLKAMRAMSEAELIATSRDILLQSEVPKHMAEARKQMFDQVRKAIATLSEEEKRKIIDFDPLTQEDIPVSDEAVFENLVTPQEIDLLGQQLAKNAFQNDLENFIALEPKYNDKVRRKDPMDKMIQDLGFYESPVTGSEFSDDERLFGMRYARPLDGQEALQTQESIKIKVNLDIVKRTYLKRLAAKSRLGEAIESHFIDQEEQQEERLMKYFHELDQSTSLLRYEAKQINRTIEGDTTLEGITKNLDFLLLGAPQFVKDLYHDPNNKLKGYESRFQDIEKKQSLLWKDFETTFKTIFPESKVTEEEVVEGEDEKILEHNLNIQPLFTDSYNTIKQTEDTFSIELYKELNHPVNLQFFHHYLTNIFRVNRDQINDGLQAFSNNMNPYTYEIPKTAMIAEEEDPDLKPEEEEEAKIQAFEEKDAIELGEKIEKEYNEASLLTYVGKGKRKSSTCLVQIQKGVGEVTINGKNVINYFTHPYYRRTALRVIELAFMSCLIDVEIVVRGGSQSAQAQCICSGLSRALVKMCPSLKNIFRKLELTTTDARKVERKKVGLYKARKKYPYSRR